MLDDIWDAICDVWDYIIGFEWLEDVWDFFTGMFESIGDFSVLGLLFGVAVVAFVYALREYMLNPFLVHMSPATAAFWGLATYVGCGGLGYLVGKSLFDRD